VAADLLQEMGARIVAVTDWKSGVHNAKGLDIKALIAHNQEHRTVDGFPGETITNDDLFGSTSTC
jgi:glutamate dehydrogenase/leucine dehydrogenase